MSPLFYGFKRTEAGISPSHTPYVYMHIVEFYIASNIYYTLYVIHCKEPWRNFQACCEYTKGCYIVSPYQKRNTVMPESMTVIFYYSIYINVGQAVVQIWLSLLKAGFLYRVCSLCFCLLNTTA